MIKQVQELEVEAFAEQSGWCIVINNGVVKVYDSKGMLRSQFGDVCEPESKADTQLAADLEALKHRVTALERPASGASEKDKEKFPEDLSIYATVIRNNLRSAASVYGKEEVKKAIYAYLSP